MSFSAYPLRGGLQRMDHVQANVLLDIHVDTGVPVEKAGQQAREHAGGGGHMGLYPNAALRAFTKGFHVQHHPLEQREQVAQMCQQRVAGGGQGNPAVVPIPLP